MPPGQPFAGEGGAGVGSRGGHEDGARDGWRLLRLKRRLRRCVICVCSVGASIVSVATIAKDEIDAGRERLRREPGRRTLKEKVKRQR